MCTIPVPSSVVTKSPGITRNASSGASIGWAQSISCSYRRPTRSAPVTVASTSDSGAFLSPKCLPCKAAASTTTPASPVYRLAVLTMWYSMFSPMVRAVLDGSVHGVVVQASKSTGNGPAPPPAMARTRSALSGRSRNWDTTVVSVTSR